MIAIVVALFFSAVIPAETPKLASDLRAGMVLVYASGGQDQPAWSIDLVEAGAPLKDHADCARTRLNRRPGGPMEENRLCVEHDMLYAWNEDRVAWLPQRPVGPGMELALPRADGGSVRYVTGSTSVEVIGGLRLQVLETTVTTMDASGRAVRRLRERYAITLATATGGRFEVPDPDDPNAWRLQQNFELREIR